MKTDKSFYHSKQWETVRDGVLRRDGYQCQYCKRYGRLRGASHVHHINPIEIYPELALARWNLVSLCRECHNRMHDRDSHEDYITWLRILRKYGDAAGINLPYLQYRVTQGSKSGNKLKSAVMTFRAYRYAGCGIPESILHFASYALNGIKKYY